MNNTPHSRIIDEFRLIDFDHDGKISREDLKHALIAVGKDPKPEVIDQIMSNVDTDKSGDIEFNEFLKVVSIKRGNEVDKPNESADDDGETLFQAFDKNHDGFISIEEIKMTMLDLGEYLSENDLNEMMDAVDINGDRLITRAEFRELLKYYWDKGIKP
ncbi:hypothetical protein GJ496_002869 [Pomphorhynchus laevis]|nr:hypothetical protein GJ496_002869 [Pomphorhynchus laevis]